MFDAPICGCVLLIANILCLFSGWTSWYERTFCYVDFVHHIVLFGVNPINKTRTMIFCCTSYCLVGSYTLFGWILHLSGWKFCWSAQVSSERGLWARKAIPWGIWGSGPEFQSDLSEWDLEVRIWWSYTSSHILYLLRWKVFYIGIYIFGVPVIPSQQFEIGCVEFFFDHKMVSHAYG